MDIMPECLPEKKKRKHRNKERSERMDDLRRNIVNGNDLPIEEMCEIALCSATQLHDNKKKKRHKVIKNNDELIVETYKIESSDTTENHPKKEKMKVGESVDVLSKTIVKNNYQVVEEAGELTSGSSTKRHHNKKRHKLIKNNDELVEIGKIESRDIIEHSVKKKKKRHRNEVRESVDQHMEDMFEISLNREAKQPTKKKRKRQKMIRNIDDELTDTRKIESSDATEHHPKKKQKKHRIEEVSEIVDVLTKTNLKNNDQLVKAAGELTSGSEAKQCQKKRKSHKMIKNCTTVMDGTGKMCVDTTEENYTKKKRHKNENVVQIENEDVAKAITLKSYDTDHAQTIAHLDPDLMIVSSDEDVMCSNYSSDFNNKERKLSPNKSMAASISSESSVECSESESMPDDDYLPPDDDYLPPDDDDDGVILPDYTVLDEKSKIKWPLEGVGPPHFRYFLAEKENDIVHPPEQVHYSRNGPEEKRLKSIGWNYRSNRWTYKEDERLQYNWNKYFKDYPKLDPLMVVSAGRTHRFQCVNFKAFNRFLKKTKFYLRLAHGLNRTLYNCYRRGRILFYPHTKSGKFSAEDIVKLKSLQAQYGNKWYKIATMMDRHGIIVNHAWNKLTDTRTYAHGLWIQEEADRLKNAVCECGADPYTMKMGKWENISENVGTRSAGACRSKWLKTWLSKGLDVTIPKKWSVKDRVTLIKSLSVMDVYDEIEIDWKEFADNFPNKPPTEYLKHQYYRLRIAIPHYLLMSFNERRDYMFDNFMPVNPDISDDDDDQGDEGGDDNGNHQGDNGTGNRIQTALENQENDNNGPRNRIQTALENQENDNNGTGNRIQTALESQNDNNDGNDDDDDDDDRKQSSCHDETHVISDDDDIVSVSSSSDDDDSSHSDSIIS